MARYYDMDKLSEMIEAKADTMLTGKEILHYIAKWLNLLPAADVVEVKHGYWKRVRFVNMDDPDGGYWIVRCNQCSIPHCKEYGYCPSCGAKMDGGKAE